MGRPRLQDELDELERTDPAVAKAAREYDEMSAQIRAQPLPERLLTCEDGCEVLCVRVGGNALCPGCEVPYWKHRYCRGQLSGLDGRPFLHVACDGRHLKL